MASEYEAYLASLEGGLPEQQADSLIDKALGVLSLPRQAVETGFSALTGIDIPVSAGASIREATGFAPQQGDTIPGRLAGTAIEFAGDIAADPLTYLGVGLAGRAAKVRAAQKALSSAEPLATAAKEVSLRGVTDLETLKNLTMGMNRFLPQVQLGADIGFGTAAGLSALQAGTALVPKLASEGITSETAELAARTTLAGGAATLPILQYRHITKDAANWRKLQEGLAKAKASVPQAATPAPYAVNAPGKPPVSPYDLAPKPVVPEPLPPVAEIPTEPVVTPPPYPINVPEGQPASPHGLASTLQPLPPPSYEVPGMGLFEEPLVEPPPAELPIGDFHGQPQPIPKAAAPVPTRRPPTPRPEQAPAEAVAGLVEGLQEPEGAPTDWRNTDLGQGFVGLLSMIKDREVNVSTKELDQLMDTFGIKKRYGGARGPKESNQNYARNVLALMDIAPEDAPQAVKKYGRGALLQGGLGFQGAWEGAQVAARLLKQLWTRRTRSAASPEVLKMLEGLEAEAEGLREQGLKDAAFYAGAPERALRHDIETIKAAPFEPMSLEEAQARSSVGKSTTFEEGEATKSLPNLQPVRPRAAFYEDPDTRQMVPAPIPLGEPIEAGPATEAPGRAIEGQLPQPRRLATGKPGQPIGRQFSQGELEAARAGEGEFPAYPKQRPKPSQRAEIDPKVAAMFEEPDAPDFLKALRAAVPKLPEDVAKAKIADRFSNALTNFLRQRDWYPPEKLKATTPIRLGGGYTKFGTLVERFGQDRAEFIAAFQRFATKKGAAAGAALEEAAGGLTGYTEARTVGNAAAERELVERLASAKEQGLELSKDEIDQIKSAARRQFGLPETASLETPVGTGEKPTTLEAQVAELPDARGKVSYRGAEPEVVDKTLGLVPELNKQEAGLLRAYLKGGKTLQQIIEEAPEYKGLTLNAAEGIYDRGLKKVLDKLDPIARHGNVAAYVRVQKAPSSFNPVLESVQEILAKASDKEEARNILVSLHRERLLAHIDKIEKSEGAVVRLDMLANKLGFKRDPEQAFWKGKQNATRKARELRKLLGIEKRPGTKLYSGVDPELAVQGAKALTGAVANLIRRMVRGSSGSAAEVEGIAKTVAETAPTFKAEPTTEQLKAAYAGPRQQQPAVHTKPSGRGGVERGPINTEALGLDPSNPRDAKLITLHQDLAEVTGTRGRTTFAEINQAADDLINTHGYDAVVADVNNDLLKGKVSSPEAAAVARRKALATAELFMEAREQSQAAAATHDVNVMKEANRLANDALMKATALSSVVKDVKRIAAQSLVSFKMVPENVVEDIRGRFLHRITNDPAIRPKYVESIMEAFDGFMAHRTDDYAKAFQAALATAVKHDWWDMFSEGYKSALIGPPSFVANTISNKLQIAVNTLLKQTLTPIIDSLIAKKTGQRSIYAVPAHLQMEAMMAAVKESWPTAWKDLRDAFLAKEYVATPEDLIQDRLSAERGYSRAGGAIPNPVIMGKKIPLGELLRISFKLLNVDDVFSKHIIKAREFMQSAYTYARKNGAGLSANEIEALTLKRFSDLVDWQAEKLNFQKLQTMHGTDAAKTLQHELSKEVARINQNVQDEVFQRPFKELGRSFVKWAKYTPVVRQFDTLNLPFKQTPWNVTREAIAYTPVKGLQRVGQLAFGELLEALNPNTPAKRMAELTSKYGNVTQDTIAHELAKSALGTTIMGGLFYLGMSDVLTGGGPVDPRQQALKRQTGWQPYSINIGKVLGGNDQWVSYQRFEPFSSMFGFSSDMAEAVKHGDFKRASTAAERITGSIAENLTNKTFLSGLEGVFTLFHDPKQYMGRYVKQLEGSLVPNVIGPVPFGTLGRAMDPLMRQTEAFTTEPMQAKIPGLSEKLLPQVGPTGEVRYKPGYSTAERLLSPFSRSKRREGALADAADILNELGYAPALPKKTLNISGRDIRLTEEEQKILMKAQEQAAERVARIAKDPTFRRLYKDEGYAPVGYKGKTQKSILEKVYEDFRTSATRRVREMIYRRGALKNGQA